MTRAVHHIIPTAFALVLAASAASAETLRPKFDPDKFEEGQQVDSKYFPLVPGPGVAFRTRSREDGERIRERSVLRTLDRPGPRIEGVRATILLDKEYEDGLLVEKTFDYFAQDKRGNVWYLGEDVTNYHYDKKGNLVRTDHESEWRAGRHGAKPGWIMPARQIIGQRYFQERARRDEALDKAETHGIVPRMKVGGTVYRNVLRVLETNPFEPKAREFKYYAPRVGLIRIEEGLNKNLEKPEVVFNRHERRGKAADRSGRGGGKAADRAGRSGGEQKQSARSGGKKR